MTRAALLVLLTACSSVPRGRDFWLALKARDFGVPAGESTEAIFIDSEALLGVPDGRLRDDVGYGLSVAWLLKERRVSDEVLRAHTTRLLALMRSPNVLARSFAALRLSVVAAVDVRTPLLDDGQRAQLLAAAEFALAHETDLRGHDEHVGWVHATAHVADVLKFLAKNPKLTDSQQARIAAAVTTRLGRGVPFSWGEDERLAQVLRWLVLRDADTHALEQWLTTLEPAWKALWQAQKLDTARYAALNNTKLTLRALLLLLDAQDEPLPKVQAFRARVLEVSAVLF
jgi:hypothetical protein